MFKKKFDEILKRLNFIESKIEEQEEKEETEEVKRQMIDEEINDNKNYPAYCYNLFLKYTSNGKIEINGYQKYRLISIISMDQEISFNALISFYFTLDANERIILLSTLINDGIDDGDEEDNYLLKLINANFIFTCFEMTMIVSYIAQFEEWELVNPLTKKYSIPQNLRDLLNSKAVLDSLIKEK